jgi:phage terminase small subunit
MSRDYTDEGTDPESGVTFRERAAVDYYLISLNKTRAYHQAGYAAETYTHARKDANVFFDRPHIRSYLDERIKERNKRLKVSADMVLQEACIIAFSRITDYRIDPNTGRAEVRPGCPQEVLGAVKAVEASKTTKVLNRACGDTETTHVWTGKIVLWDKTKAIELLSKHCGLIADKLPPLELLLARLPAHIADILRRLLSGPPSGYALTDKEQAQLAGEEEGASE